MADEQEVVVRSKEEDDRILQRARELEAAEARRKEMAWVRCGLSLGLFALTGIYLDG